MRAVTIGNFDGVHLGHQAIVRQARALTLENGGVTAVVFEPLPSAVLQPHSAPPRLTMEPFRTELLVAAGCSEVVHLDPRSGVLDQEPEAFLRSLHERFEFDAIVEGADFRFGRGRRGTVQTLQELGKQIGFQVVVVAEHQCTLEDGYVVAPRSSLIRWLLEMGRVRDAARLLGRPYDVSGAVVQGDQRGRELGFPTANVACHGQQLPADGVYAGTAHTPVGTYVAAISIGTKPTFPGRPRTCEAHIIGFSGVEQEYGWPIRIEFLKWLREQWRFPSTDALIQQIHRDVAQCA